MRLRLLAAGLVAVAPVFAADPPVNPDKASTAVPALTWDTVRVTSPESVDELKALQGKVKAVYQKATPTTVGLLLGGEGGAEVNEQAGDPLGESPSEGPVAASDAVVRFTMKYPGTTGSADKMVVFGVTDSGGKRVVAYAWCELKKANYWEQRMMLLVGTLKGLK